MKEHVTFSKESGHLHVKYPCKKDPGILIDNGREAMVCQISQEKRQIKNSTHSQYVEQFKDRMSRKVVSEISPSEKAANIGPINYITHHKVYKPRSLLTLVGHVSNSSFRNRNTNLNYLCVKGPNTLADIFENLLKFHYY